jgi:transposase InsO family protein
VPTDEGWLYLAGIIDGFSKRMVGYAMAEQMKTELVLQALHSAMLKRKPSKGLIHHSDKGSQYTSYLYQHALHNNHMLASFTDTGACFGQRSAEACRLMLSLKAFGPR